MAPQPDILHQLSLELKSWAKTLGFAELRVCTVELSPYAQRLKQWLAEGYQGSMAWMADHGDKRYRPEQLHPGTLRVLSARMTYLPDEAEVVATLKNQRRAYIARYALGRDYHKLMRKRLAQLAKRLETRARELGIEQVLSQRPFVDSAPVMEKPLGEKAGHGWIGKNTLLINSRDGSYFFLGEIFTNLPLPVDPTEQADQCGECQACLKVCPTDAFPRPYVLDASRCISYFTIEHRGAIPIEFREAMGNRIFGCDDCQAICPWNKEPATSSEQDFAPRHDLNSIELLELFRWDEATFLKNTEGSAIRRIGYEGWQRNLAIALGNAPPDLRIQDALQQRLASASPLVREHILWALEQQPLKRRRRKVSRP